MTRLFEDDVNTRIIEHTEAIAYYKAQGQSAKEEVAKLELGLAQSLKEAIDMHGAAIVMKQLQDYILDFDTPIDDQAFINYLLAEHLLAEDGNATN